LVQIAILEAQIDKLPKRLTPNLRKKLIRRWSINNRSLNPETPRWETYGTSGNILIMTPLESQKFLYEILMGPNSKYIILCCFEEYCTKITITETPSEVTPGVVKYSLEIPYKKISQCSS